MQRRLSRLRSPGKLASFGEVSPQHQGRRRTGPSGKVEEDRPKGVLGEGRTERVTGAVDDDVPDTFARIAPA